MLKSAFARWLDESAELLDSHSMPEAGLLKRLAAEQLLSTGLSGANYSTSSDAISAFEAITAVAEHSLTAAFVLWGQRVFIELLVNSENLPLKERLLPDLLQGTLAGATGLSNAMKFLAGIEPLRVEANPIDDDWLLKGHLPWLTNIPCPGFVVAVTAHSPRENALQVFALPHHAEGLIRSADLDLLGMRTSDTAALTLDSVRLGADWLLHSNARDYLPQVRPAFLAMQCGLACGVARRALYEANACCGTNAPKLQACIAQVEAAINALKDGLAQGLFLKAPARQFEIRIQLTELAMEAVQLELTSKGGNAYTDKGFARRWREAAFLPILTPSLLQLKAQLQQASQAVRQ